MECFGFFSQNQKTDRVTLQETVKRNGHKRQSSKLSGRVFSRSEPLVITMMNVFAPSIRGEIEIVRQQIGQLSRGLSPEDALHNMRLLRNSMFLLQVVVKSKTKYNILRFKPRDFEFRNSLNILMVGISFRLM
jgi:hypothetical protein